MNANRRSRTRLLALPLAAALALAACGGGDDDDAADEPTTEESTGAGGDGGGDGGGDAVTTDAPGGSSPASTPDAGTPADPNPDDGAPVVVTLPPDTTPDPVQGGTLRLAIEAEVDGLNPTVNQVTAASGLMMAAAVFDTLAATNVDGDPVPYLAETITPNEDYTTWDVKVRPGITFHDGTPLDAAAVQANFEAQRANSLVGLAVAPFFPETGATEILDDMTIRYHLLDANVRWPAILTSQLGMVASPTWLEAALADPTLNQQPVGTGPFVFESRSEDSVTTFVRNDAYWNGTPYLDAVEYLPMPDQAQAADLLYSGEIDGLHTADPGTVADLRGDDTLVNLLDDTGDERFVIMNSEQPPFDDLRARQALTFATPRQNVLDLIGLGQWRGANGRFIPESPYHNPAVVQEGDDPARAAELAAEYCAERGSEENPVTGEPTCTDGRINIEYQWSGPSVAQTRLADVLIEGWSSAFNVTRDEKLQDEHIVQTATGAYNTVTWTQFNDPEPLNDNVWVLCRTIGGISLNFPRYCDEQRDATLLQAAATLDDAERAGLLQQAEQLIHDSYTYVFLGHLLWDYAFGAHVHGQCDRTSPEGERLMCVRQGNIWPTTIWVE